MKILLTGGAGFIGSAVVRQLIRETDAEVVNVDKLTYAGNLGSLAEARDHPRHHFEHVDLCDAAEVARVFEQHRPDAVMHLAAESHVDRSIDGPGAFVQTNVVGTFTLLHAARAYWGTLEGSARYRFRFHHVSTDEVYGSLGATGYLHRSDPLRPAVPLLGEQGQPPTTSSGPGTTPTDMPTLVTNCSNNYGPYHFPEKLIPLVILNAKVGQALADLRQGGQRARLAVRRRPRQGPPPGPRNGEVPGETYNIGGHNERTNLEVVKDDLSLCSTNWQPGLRPTSRIGRPDHLRGRPPGSRRSAMPSTRAKIGRELGWRPAETFETGLRRTVAWYLEPTRPGAATSSPAAISQQRLGLESPPVNHAPRSDQRGHEDEGDHPSRGVGHPALSR